jgi:hypothetical protein
MCTDNQAVYWVKDPHVHLSDVMLFSEGNNIQHNDTQHTGIICDTV